MFEHILDKLCDASDIRCDALRATSTEHDGPPPDTLRPKIPLPDDSRTLRRTISYASIDTIHPSSTRGIRRRINEIADNLKPKSTKKTKHLSTHGVPQSAAHDLDSKAPPPNKGTLRKRKAAALLREISNRSTEESILAIADRLHNRVLSERGSSLDHESNPLVDNPLAKGDEQILEGSGLPTARVDPGLDVAAKCQGTLQSPRTPKIGIKDVQLGIRPSVSDVTIWDGLQAAHHLFKCRLYLRCTTHPYDGVSLPDIRRIEMNCNTFPVGSRYAKPPVLQAAYEGASPDWITGSGGLPNVNLAAGIHMDRFWRTILDEDGTWGWYRDAFVPLSSRLFDRMEYREFKLVSRVWMEDSCVEGELTFGISMLLREVYMK